MLDSNTEILVRFNSPEQRKAFTKWFEQQGGIDHFCKSDAGKESNAESLYVEDVDRGDADITILNIE